MITKIEIYLYVCVKKERFGGILHYLLFYVFLLAASPLEPLGARKMFPFQSMLRSAVYKKNIFVV